jgi:ankyrin repeat protein
MTKLLLEAGANPDDNESIYHSIESRDSTCTRLLLDAGAKVAGTNAIARLLDYGKLDDLKLMLRLGGDAKEHPWIHHAILRGRSLDHIRVLVAAGADLRATNHGGISLYRWAQMFGRVDVVELLREAGIEETLTDEEQFVAACTRRDEAAARALLKQEPDIVSRLSPRQLQTLPELADVGDLRAVEITLDLGWPRETKVAWDATALNLSVYRGDARMPTKERRRLANETWLWG